MIFNWTISAMDCIVELEGLTDVVKTVHWRYSAKETVGEKEYFAESYGAQEVGVPTPADFTNYNSLTKEQVVSWLEAKLDVVSLKENLEKQVNLQITPLDVTLPPPFEN